MEENQSSLIAHFCSVTGASSSVAENALTSTNWNIEEAISYYYTSQDQPAEGTASDDDEPVAQAMPAQPSRAGPSSTRPPQNQSRMRTLKDLQGGSGSGPEEEESDDEGQDMFAGGEKSGLAVQNPNNRPQDHFNNLIRQAREGRERPPGDEEPAPSSNFSGRAQTLGGDDAPSQVVEDPEAASRPSRLPRIERTLHLWQDGFSVDDGPLYRFDDPANTQILALINQGRAPLSILNAQPGQEVDLNLNPHKDEKYVQPKKQFKAFEGSGQRLGSPTPGLSGVAAPPSASTASSSTQGQSAASKPSASTVQIDESQPTLSLQVRLGDGTRLQSRFNTSHTVGDVYEFVNASNAESRSRNYALMTTFPSKELSDKSQVLGDMADFKRGGVVVQKWT